MSTMNVVQLPLSVDALWRKYLAAGTTHVLTDEEIGKLIPAAYADSKEFMATAARLITSNDLDTLEAAEAYLSEALSSLGEANQLRRELDLRSWFPPPSAA